MKDLARIKIKEHIIGVLNAGLKEKDASHITCAGSFSRHVQWPLIIPEFINAARDDVEDMLILGYDFFENKRQVLRSKILTLAIGVYSTNDEESQSICSIAESIIAEKVLNVNYEGDGFVYRIRIFDDTTTPELRDSGSEKLFYSAIPCEVNLRYKEFI